MELTVVLRENRGRVDTRLRTNLTAWLTAVSLAWRPNTVTLAAQAARLIIHAVAVGGDYVRRS